ncbi:hypothetical protein N9A28_00865 [Sulfurimonas sp.]|nr:hypothetical protein [Sulfurimonas sp.]
MYKIIIYSLVLVMFSACGNRITRVAESYKAQIKKPKNYEKVQAAFKESLNTYNSNSRWFQDAEQLELTIIGPVYKNPIEKQSESYKKLFSLLKKIANDKTLLDKLSGSDISQRYSKINYIPYKLGSKEDTSFSAVYEHRLDSKDKLTQTLQQLDANGKDKVGQTLAIWINPQDLKNNIYTLEGYKSVKNSTKNRNSAYYHLSKQQSNGTDNQDIVNALLATLQLSIPEYVAIDRKDMLKQGETFRIITDNPDGTATGKVYKFDIESEVDKLKEQKSKTTDQNQIAKLDKQIKEVKASKAWREYETKQLLYTTPVSQEDIDILNRYRYIKTTNKFNQLITTDANEISKALHYALPDPFLMVTFEQYRVMLNELGIYVGDITQLMKAYYLKGVNKVDMENSRDLGYLKYLAKSFIKGRTAISTEKTKRANEDKQIDLFFGVSKNSILSNGFSLVNETQVSQIGKEVLYINKEDKPLTATLNNSSVFYIADGENALYKCSNKDNAKCTIQILELRSDADSSQMKASDDGTLYITLHNDESELHVYDTNSKKLLYSTVISNKEKITKMALSKRGNLLALLSDSMLYLYDIKNFKKLGSVKSDGEDEVIFSEDENLLAIGSKSVNNLELKVRATSCKIYSTKSLENLYSIDLPKKYVELGFLIQRHEFPAATPIYFNVENNKLFLMPNATTILSWDYKKNKILETDSLDLEHNPWVLALSISDNKKYMIFRDNILAWDVSSVYLYDRSAKKLYNTGLSGAGWSMHSFEFSSNSKNMLVKHVNRSLAMNFSVRSMQLFNLEHMMEIAEKEY